MMFDEEVFTGAILNSVRNSAKDASGMQCWSKMHTFMNNMDETMQSFFRRDRSDRPLAGSVK